MVEQPTRSEGKRIVIEMWSDLGCPWCYIGKHRLRAAIAQRPDADRFEIVIRSFELDPGAPHEPEENEKSFLRAHGGTAADVRQAERRMQALARREGLEYSLNRLNANTFGLHRVVRYANDQGRGFDFFSTVQDGFFADAQPLRLGCSRRCRGGSRTGWSASPGDPREQRVHRPSARRP